MFFYYSNKFFIGWLSIVFTSLIHVQVAWSWLQKTININRRASEREMSRKKLFILPLYHREAIDLRYENFAMNSTMPLSFPIFSTWSMTSKYWLINYLMNSQMTVQILQKKKIIQQIKVWLIGKPNLNGKFTNILNRMDRHRGYWLLNCIRQSWPVQSYAWKKCDFLYETWLTMLHFDGPWPESLCLFHTTVSLWSSSSLAMFR